MTEREDDERALESLKGTLEGEISSEHFSKEDIEKVRIYRLAVEQRLQELNQGRTVAENFLRRLPREEMIKLIAEHGLTDLLVIREDSNNE